MEVIYPDTKRSLDKATLLDRFKSDGFYLIDVVDFPINDLSDGDRKAIILRELPNKIKKIHELIDFSVRASISHKETRSRPLLWCSQERRVFGKE